MVTVEYGTTHTHSGARPRRVGRFTLQPFRELKDQNRPVGIKPKALAILSVLAEADGGLVTKDDLMTAVWRSAIVEDNALQAHITALRKVLGPDAELLSTVHGQGYRLASSGDDLPVEAVAGEGAGRRPIFLAALFVLLVLGGAGVWLLHPDVIAPANPPVQVAVMPFDLASSGPEIAQFGNDLRDRIAADLVAMQILAVTPGGKDASATSKPMNSEFQLTGRILSDGTMLRLRVQLVDSKEGAAVWSGSFEKSMAERASLLPLVSTAVADAAHFGVIGRRGKVRLDAAGIAALIEARDSITAVNRPNPNLQMADYRKIIATTPDFSWAHSGLAVADAFQLRSEPDNAQLRQEIQTEAHRALELEPANGEAYVALEIGLPRFDWQSREALLLKGNKADPAFGPIPVMEGRLAAALGREQDALFWMKRAHAIDPLHNGNTFEYAVALLLQGRPGESRKLLADMDAGWPEHSATRNAHFWISLISGTTGETLAILSDSSRWPVAINQTSAQVWRAALMAHDSPSRADDTQAIKRIKTAAAEGSLGRGDALMLLSILNDVDGAFEQAQSYLPADPQWGPILFLPPTQAMRQDPRFIGLAAKLGFAAYWRSTGRWPDYCKESGLPYDCQAEVAKLAATNPELDPMPEIAAIIPN